MTFSRESVNYIGKERQNTFIQSRKQRVPLKTDPRSLFLTLQKNENILLKFAIDSLCVI